MADITAQLVKDLRARTSAGMMDCKKALVESGGDIEKAIEVLRKKGLKSVNKRADKTASQGLVYSYIHGDGRIGVLIELNCETDFVARGDDFQELSRAIAMHIAWAAPRFLQREDVTPEILKKEEEVLLAQLKPDQQQFADKIIAGKMDKFYQENCLLEQLDAKEPEAKRTIGDMITAVSAKVGEKIVLRRFVRYELGDGVNTQATDE